MMINPKERCMLTRDRKTGKWFVGAGDDPDKCELSHDVAKALPIKLGDYETAAMICNLMWDCGYAPGTMFYYYPTSREVVE